MDEQPKQGQPLYTLTNQGLNQTSKITNRAQSDLRGGGLRANSLGNSYIKEYAEP